LKSHLKRASKTGKASCQGSRAETTSVTARSFKRKKKKLHQQQRGEENRGSGELGKADVERRGSKKRTAGRPSRRLLSLRATSKAWKKRPGLKSRLIARQFSGQTPVQGNGNRTLSCRPDGTMAKKRSGLKSSIRRKGGRRYKKDRRTARFRNQKRSLQSENFLKRGKSRSESEEKKARKTDG